jgi:hypothetical protein
MYKKLLYRTDEFKVCMFRKINICVLEHTVVVVIASAVQLGSITKYATDNTFLCIRQPAVKTKN